MVAFRLRRHGWMAMVTVNDNLSRVNPAPEWSVSVLDDGPDADGVYYVPQLDHRGWEALEFLKSFAAGLGAT